MYKVCSIFSQVLKLFSRGDFEQAVKEHKAERHARGFTSWGQFRAMLFCQLGQAHSLREICGGLACGEGQLKHLGCRWHPGDPPWPTPMSIGRGSCTRRCSSRRCANARNWCKAKAGGRSSVSKTS